MYCIDKSIQNIGSLNVNDNITTTFTNQQTNQNIIVKTKVIGFCSLENDFARTLLDSDKHICYFVRLQIEKEYIEQTNCGYFYQSVQFLEENKSKNLETLLINIR